MREESERGESESQRAQRSLLLFSAPKGSAREGSGRALGSAG